MIKKSQNEVDVGFWSCSLVHCSGLISGKFYYVDCILELFMVKD